MIVAPDIDFTKYLHGAEENPHVHSAKHYLADVLKLFKEDSEGGGKALPWQHTQDRIRIRPGETSIWAGVNGTGKSLLLNQVILYLMRQGERAMIASMEMKPAVTLFRMAQQAATCRTPSEMFLTRFFNWVDQRLFMYDQQGRVHSDRVMALARYSQSELGCTQFLIDSLMKLGLGVQDYDAQASFINELQAFGMDSGMHLHLIAHARKGSSEFDQIGKFDVKGAGEIIDQVDNVYLVNRNLRKEDFKARGIHEKDDEPDCWLRCAKQRHARPGCEGVFGLYLNRDSLTFTESTFHQPMPMAFDLPEGVIPHPKLAEVPF